MCGILCILNIYKNKLNKIAPNLQKFLKYRGPSAESKYSINNYLDFYGFVLWQQGIKPAIQPLISNTFILLFNGDIFNITKKDENLSDTEWLLNELNQCESDDEILNIFQQINGPFSVIFYDRRNDQLYFGRDSLGRNSLLIEKNDECLRILSNSYMDKLIEYQCYELDPCGIFKINLKSLDHIKLFPWLNSKNMDETRKKHLEKIFQLPIVIGKSIDCDWLRKNIVKNKTYDFYTILKNELESASILSVFLQNPAVANCVKSLLELLYNSVKDRVQNTPKYCKNCIKQLKNSCYHSKIGILFSGGLDCTILAALTNKICDPLDSIDLINVAFEPILNKALDEINYDVPDRISGRESAKELKQLFPNRKWNFIEVNVTRTELKQELENNIRHVIYPLENVLDESLGSAFWFAAKGNGVCDNLEYVSSSRIILLGSGADELFGGYIRHRNAFHRTKGTIEEKNKAVEIELQLDWDRIPSRNLSRDDRVIGFHGRTARSPFIEENFVNFVNNLHSEQKCCFELDQSIGDKLILRLCAFKMGLNFCTKLQKRAIQFGSKIANKKQNAKDISVYLKNNVSIK